MIWSSQGLIFGTSTYQYTMMVLTRGPKRLSVYFFETSELATVSGEIVLIGRSVKNTGQGSEVPIIWMYHKTV